MKVGILGLGLAVIALVSCGGETTSEQTAAEQGAGGDSGKLSVVVSGGVPCDLTKQVAGDSLEVTCLMEPGQDPHSYTLTSGDRRAVETADLVFYGGLGLEEGLVKVFEDSNAVPVFERAVPEPLLADSDPHAGHDHGHGVHDHDDHDDHEGHDHEGHDHEGHDHDDHDGEKHAEEDKHDDHDHGVHHGKKDGKFIDPHVWHDAMLGAKSVKVIARGLGELNPAAAAEYEERAAAIAQELEKLDGWIREQIATVPEENRELVTAHNAFRYYATAYGLDVPGTLGGLSHDEEPSAQDLAQLVDRLRALQVPVIFSETTVESKGTLEAVSRSAEVKLAEKALFVDGPGDESSDAPTYQKMLEVNTCAIAEGLGGNCSPL